MNSDKQPKSRTKNNSRGCGGYCGVGGQYGEVLNIDRMKRIHFFSGGGRAGGQGKARD